MPKKLYENKESLEKAINNYLTTEKNPTPRHLRVSIGLIGPSGKSLLAQWKKTQPEYYNLIKTAEDIILAHLERAFTYGGREKFNISYTLRAYDRVQYDPTPQMLELDTQLKTPVQIVMPKSLPNKKGVQSARDIKLHKRES